MLLSRRLLPPSIQRCYIACYWVALGVALFNLVGCEVGVQTVADAGCVQIGDYRVCEPILSFYRNRDGERLFGPPLEDVQTEHNPPRQCFVNVCLGVLDTGQVTLIPLGILMGYQRPPIAFEKARSSRSVAGLETLRYYPKTGHTVLPLFVDAYDRLGGPEFLGYPIAEFDLCEAGRFCQDFERARLIMTGAYGSGNAVQLGPLGKLYMEQYVAQADISPTPMVASKVQLVIQPRYPLPGGVGQQTLDIHLLDESGHGVKGIAFDIVIYDAQGTRRIETLPTNASGITTISFPLGGSPPGYRVFVDVATSWAGHHVHGRTSYIHSASHPPAR
jgi:hypothetical protein